MKKSPHPAVLTALALALLSTGLTGCFRVSSDVGALRDSVLKSASAKWDQQIEFGVGVMTLAVARAGLSFVDLEPEARTVLHAVRGAEVGVYKRRGAQAELKGGVILRAADNTMSGRGWERIVGVMNGRELVAVYAPRDVRSTRNMKVCVLVLNPEALVVASARSNLEPLMELAFNHTGRPRGDRPAF
jgi:hypothetical protein